MNQFPTVPRVRLKNGEAHEACLSHNRGGPEDPVGDENLEVKFRTNAGRASPIEKVEELRSTLGTLRDTGTTEHVAPMIRSVLGG